MSSAGILRKYVEDKGFGFISNADGSGDVFVHFSELTTGGSKDMVIGSELTFDIVVDERSGRSKAAKVTITKAAIGAWEEWEECAGSSTDHVGITGVGCIAKVGRATLDLDDIQWQNAISQVLMLESIEFSSAKLDLHDRLVDEAVHQVILFLGYWMTHYEKLEKQEGCVEKGVAFVEIITGRGLHSVHGEALILPEIRRLVDRMGLECQWASKGGALHVILTQPLTDDEKLRKLELLDKAKVARLVEARERREQAVRIREQAGVGSGLPQAAEDGPVQHEAEVDVLILSERPTLEVPPPKEMKEAMKRLQQCASSEFQKKHGLKGAGGNKLAKIKWPAFREMFDDFQKQASLTELLQYGRLAAQI